MILFAAEIGRRVTKSPINPWVLLACFVLAWLVMRAFIKWVCEADERERGIK